MSNISSSSELEMFVAVKSKARGRTYFTSKEYSECVGGKDRREGGGTGGTGRWKTYREPQGLAEPQLKKVASNNGGSGGRSSRGGGR